MKTIFNKMVLLLIATTLVCAPFAGSAFANPARDDVLGQEKEAGAMLADVLIMRPAGICGQAIGAVTFFFALPWAVWGDNHIETRDALIVKPAKHTWKRPMGEF
jgi:hypothetical protein